MGEALWIFNAYDGIIINELAYTTRTRGYLERMDGEAKVESWAWSAEQVESASPKDGRSIFVSFMRKAMVFVKSLLTFLLISAITGFFIRVAVNGSAVIMFPIAMVLQQIDTERMTMRVLIRSFPWVGVHVEVLRRAGRPLAPLFRSHFIFLFIQSFAYLSCNLAWRLILYRKSTPDGFEERVFSFCSVIELDVCFSQARNGVHGVFALLHFRLALSLPHARLRSLYIDLWLRHDILPEPL